MIQLPLPADPVQLIEKYLTGRLVGDQPGISEVIDQIIQTGECLIGVRPMIRYPAGFDDIFRLLMTSGDAPSGDATHQDRAAFDHQCKEDDKQEKVGQ